MVKRARYGKQRVLENEHPACDRSPWPPILGAALGSGVSLRWKYVGRWIRVSFPTHGCLTRDVSPYRHPKLMILSGV